MARDDRLPAGSEILLLEDDSSLRKRLAGYLRSADYKERIPLAELERRLIPSGQPSTP